jgi:hypothetical protein
MKKKLPSKVAVEFFCKTRFSIAIKHRSLRFVCSVEPVARLIGAQHRLYSKFGHNRKSSAIVKFLRQGPTDTFPTCPFAKSQEIPTGSDNLCQPEKYFPGGGGDRFRANQHFPFGPENPFSRECSFPGDPENVFRLE